MPSASLDSHHCGFLSGSVDCPTCSRYHYSLTALSDFWNLDHEIIRRLFDREPGVLVFSNHRKGKRIYRTRRVPHRVAVAVYTRMQLRRRGVVMGYVSVVVLALVGLAILILWRAQYVFTRTYTVPVGSVGYNDSGQAFEVGVHFSRSAITLIDLSEVVHVIDLRGGQSAVVGWRPDPKHIGALLKTGDEEGVLKKVTSFLEDDPKCDLREFAPVLGVVFTKLKLEATNEMKQSPRMTIDGAYEILELSSGAPENDVRHAYRDLTKVWHPDRFAHDARLQKKAEEKLKEINLAYETIVNALRRSRRDQRSAG